MEFSQLLEELLQCVWEQDCYDEFLTSDNKGSFAELEVSGSRRCEWINSVRDLKYWEGKFPLGLHGEDYGRGADRLQEGEIDEHGSRRRKDSGDVENCQTMKQDSLALHFHGSELLEDKTVRKFLSMEHVREMRPSMEQLAAASLSNPSELLTTLLSENRTSSIPKIYGLGNLAAYGSTCADWMRAVLAKVEREEMEERKETFIRELLKLREGLWTTSQLDQIFSSETFLMVLNKCDQLSDLSLKLIPAALQNYRSVWRDRSSAISLCVKISKEANERARISRTRLTLAVKALTELSRVLRGRQGEEAVSKFETIVSMVGPPSRFYVCRELGYAFRLSKIASRSSFWLALELLWHSAVFSLGEEESVQRARDPAYWISIGAESTAIEDLQNPAKAKSIWLAGLSHFLPLCTAEEQEMVSTNFLRHCFDGMTGSIESQLHTLNELALHPEIFFQILPSSSRSLRPDLERVARHACADIARIIERGSLELSNAIKKETRVADIRRKIGNEMRLVLNLILTGPLSTLYGLKDRQECIEIFNTAILRIASILDVGDFLAQISAARAENKIPAEKLDALEHLITKRGSDDRKRKFSGP